MEVAILNKRSDFLRVTKKGHKIVCRPFVLFILDDNSINNFSYGLIVSSKVGCAVIRNRIKRRLRHLIGSILNKINMQGKIVCILAKKQSYYLKFTVLEKELLNGCSKFVSSNV